jgi:hypothetical protein
MQNETDIAQYFFVDDLPGSSIPSSRLRNILENLQHAQQLSSQSLRFLESQGLNALSQLAQTAQPYETFAIQARAERSRRLFALGARREAEQAARRIQAAEEEKRQAAYWKQHKDERLARESDPRHITKIKNQELRARYGLEQFIETKDFSRVMGILRNLDRGQRLTDDDSLWLQTSGNVYFSDELRVAFHEREAVYFSSEYERTGDPWHAVNASSHYRKCKKPRDADVLLNSIPTRQQNVAKLQSALATTHGGVKRDLGNLQEALKLGTKAHEVTPSDFRPCTLLGAVNFELGNYTEGQAWYCKAMERGAKERDVDYDLKGIFARANQTQRQEIRAFLLAENPVRFKWVAKS